MTTEIPGFKLERVGSTNDEVARLLAEGHRPPLWVSAGVQTDGRGRRGRRWESPLGGVWLSLAWPAPTRPDGDAAVALAVALAAHEAIAETPELAGVRDHLRIKWPNDLLLDGRKVAGVMCERVAGEGDAMIIGVGVNADFSADGLPTDLRLPATTLRDAAGLPVDAARLEGALIKSIALHLAGAVSDGVTPGLIEAITSRLASIGQPVVLRRPGLEDVTGTLIGIDAHGAAVIETPRGAIAVRSGEVDGARSADAAGGLQG